MSKCDCYICKIDSLLADNFKRNDPFSKQISNISCAREVITTDIGMLVYNATQSNLDTSSDESIDAIMEITDNEILNSNFMSNADMSMCNKSQSIIFTMYNESLKALATDASQFLENAKAIADLKQRASFIADTNNIDTSKRIRECFRHITLELNKIATAQLG